MKKNFTVSKAVLALFVSIFGMFLNFQTNLAFAEVTLRLPAGFKSSVLVDELGNARHLVARDNGDVYVAIRQGAHKGIAALRDSDGDGAAETTEFFGPDEGGTGITIWQNYLYFATASVVYRYKFSKGSLLPDLSPETVVSGFPEQNSHKAKSITIDELGYLYVNVGAPSNACQKTARSPGSPGMRPCPQLERQAGIWRFRADKLNQTQKADGTRWVTGLRNAVALEWNPVVHKLYLVQHGRDQLHQLFPKHFTVDENAALPAEEFHRVTRGSNLGWPYTYFDHIKGKRMLAPEYGGDGTMVAKQGYQNPLIGFPGHWAPNDLIFYTGNQFPKEYRGGAFIAFHGSWDRAPKEQRGYKVVFVPLKNGEPAGDYRTFAEGFTGRDVVQHPGQAKHRPMGLALGPDGSLFISDSVQGRIWKISYEKTKNEATPQ